MNAASSPTTSSSFPVCVVCHEPAIAPIKTCSRDHVLCYHCLVQYFNSKYPEFHRQDSLVLPCPMCRSDGPRSVVFSRPDGFEPTANSSPCLALVVNQYLAHELVQIYGRDGATPSWWRCSFCVNPQHALPPRVWEAYASILNCPNQTRVCHKARCRRPSYTYAAGFQRHKQEHCTAIRCRVCHRFGTFAEQQRHFPVCRDVFTLANDLSIAADQLSLCLLDGSVPDRDRYKQALDLFNDEALIEKLLNLHSALTSASFRSSSSSSSS